jgi:murein DD-endopeptidase MepM/ murein hydrolase activator NlpD
MRHRKYILDVIDLQYKQVKLPWKQKIIRAFIWLAVSAIISVFYLTVFENYFGSPKEKLLDQDIENLKLQYSLLDRKFADANNIVKHLQKSDDIKFRPILDMDSLPASFRNPGYGGVNRYRDIEGLTNASLLISTHEKVEALKNISKVQKESFIAISERVPEWQSEQDHLPKICPVDVSISRGEGWMLRQVHPITGLPQMHYGQDFNAPYGTNVFATGDGKVIKAGWEEGYGYCVIIDHGYGYESIYGHLSKIEVPSGLNVKRGDLIGLSGNSGNRSTGPHLHYEVRVNGDHQDALNFFADDLSPEKYREMILTLTLKSKFR